MYYWGHAGQLTEPPILGFQTLSCNILLPAMSDLKRPAVQALWTQHALPRSLRLLRPIVVDQHRQQKVPQLAVGIIFHAARQCMHLTLKFQDCALQSLPNMEGQDSVPHVVITCCPACP